MDVNRFGESREEWIEILRQLPDKQASALIANYLRTAVGSIQGITRIIKMELEEENFQLENTGADIQDILNQCNKIWNIAEAFGEYSRGDSS